MDPLTRWPSGRRYGFIHAPRKVTDYGISSVPGLKFAALPPIDLHLGQFMGEVRDQGDLGACVFFTAVEDREALARQFEGESPVLSPLFGYYKGRELDGTIAAGDVGSTGETSCKVLRRFGLCLESEDPYAPRDYNVSPTPAQMTSAVKWRAGAYHSIFTLEDIKSCIVSGYRVRIGMNVYQSFEDVGASGLVPVPDPAKETLLGGHEVLGYGYDDRVRCPGASLPGALLFRNHWGRGFGLSGDGWLPYSSLAVIVPDFKMQHLGKAWGVSP